MLEPMLPSSSMNRVLYQSRTSKAEYFLKTFSFSWAADSYDPNSFEFCGQSLVSCELGDSMFLQVHLRFCTLNEDNDTLIKQGALERRKFELLPGFYAREQRASIGLNLFLDANRSPFTLLYFGGSKFLKNQINRPLRKSDLMGPLTPVLLYLRAVEFGVQKLLSSWTEIIDRLERELATEVRRIPGEHAVKSE